MQRSITSPRAICPRYVQCNACMGRDGHVAQVTELTGGQGPNIILEMLANVNLQKDLEVL